MLNTFIGIPYASHGRTFQACDCWGIVCLFYEFEMHRKLPFLAGEYSDATNNSEVNKVVGDSKYLFNEIKYEDRKHGDIILFNLHGNPVHAGIVLDADRMLHSLAGHNSCVERYSSTMWNSRIEGVYRYEGNT